MIFVFVTPTCEKKLKTLTEATGILDETQRTRSCSLIVMFLESLTPASISRLVHVFWNIGQKSLFGPVFTEVDQQGALQLLGNIKPHIMERVTHRTKNPTTYTTVTNGHDIARDAKNVDSVNLLTISSQNFRQPHQRKCSYPQRIDRVADIIPPCDDLILTSRIGLNAHVSSTNNSDSEDRLPNPYINVNGDLHVDRQIDNDIILNTSPSPLESYQINFPSQVGSVLLRSVEDRG